MAITLPRFRPRTSVQWERDKPAPTPVPAPPRERKQAEGATLLVAGVGAPLARALVTGGLVGTVLFTLLAWWGFAARDVIGGSFTAAAAVTLVAWLRSYTPSWAVVERMAGVDLDGNGVIGPPPRTVTVNTNHTVETPHTKQLQMASFTLPEGVTLGEIARSVVGGTFTVGKWTGVGQVFSRSTFEDFRAELMELRLIRWKNPESPQQGVEMCEAAQERWIQWAKGE